MWFFTNDIKPIHIIYQIKAYEEMSHMVPILGPNDVQWRRNFYQSHCSHALSSLTIFPTNHRRPWGGSCSSSPGESCRATNGLRGAQTSTKLAASATRGHGVMRIPPIEGGTWALTGLGPRFLGHSGLESAMVDLKGERERQREEEEREREKRKRKGVTLHPLIGQLFFFFPFLG